jgi:hypothetical protein
VSSRRNEQMLLAGRTEGPWRTCTRAGAIGDRNGYLQAKGTRRPCCKGKQQRKAATAKERRGSVRLCSYRFVKRKKSAGVVLVRASSDLLSKVGGAGSSNEGSLESL